VLNRLQQLLLEALLSDDPPERLSRLAEEAPGLCAAERARLRDVDADGLVMTALLLKKLRFDFLTAADPALAEFFERAPEQFVETFRAYTAAVPPTAFFAGQEARCYRRWREQSGAPPSAPGLP
jgi:hypothetical protein